MPESPADTIRRAAQSMRAALGREEDPDSTPSWLYSLADSWDALAAEMADYPAVVLPSGGVGIASRPAEPSLLWTRTFNAACAYLGEGRDA